MDKIYLDYKLFGWFFTGLGMIDVTIGWVDKLSQEHERLLAKIDIATVRGSNTGIIPVRQA